MATIDLAAFAGAGIAQSTHSTRFPFVMVDYELNLATAATSKGSALAADDVIQVIDLPPATVVIAAGIEVITAQSGSSVLTFDLGVTGVEADNFVDGFDAVAAVAGDYAALPAAFQPIQIGNTADTLDVLIATLDTTNTGGKFRIWAILGDVSDVKRPGLTALGS